MPQRRRPKISPLGSERAPVASRNPSVTEFPLFLLVCFVAVAVGFTILYFVDAPPESRAQRLSVLVFLLAPDHLFELWCGGKLIYFSLLDRWPIVLMSATILTTAWMAGRLLLFGLGAVRVLDWLEQFVFAIGAGLNLLSLYALAIGLAGGLQQRWLFIGPIAVLVAANVYLAFLARGQVSPHAREVSEPFEGANDPRWYWWLVAALPFALVIVLGAMLPPGDYDVREYHLQAPKEWYQNGRIDFLPHNIYANMPLGSELTGLWAMALAGGKDGWWWGALTSKTVMACYSLVAAAALIAFGRRLDSLAVGVIAAVIFLTAPWIVSLATAGYNEGPVALYALLAIYALWLASKETAASNVSRLTILSGFCAGSAVACKYPPLLFVVMPLAAWIAGRWCIEFAWSLVI